MQIQVHGNQLDVGDALREHVEESLGASVTKYFDRPFEANVYFSRQKNTFHVQCSVHIGAGINVQSHFDANDPYVAFDNAVDRLQTQLRRYKRRLKNHHKSQRSLRSEDLIAQNYVLAAEPEGAEESDEPMEPAIIAETNKQISTLTVGEAVMRMDLEDMPAFMFRNKSHGRLNMVYRRPDGNVAWLDPQIAE